MYQYKPLNGSTEEIRLVTLLPGEQNERIALRISHTILRVPESTVDQRMVLRDLRETLPAGWWVDKTLDGRYLFINLDGGPSSWDHPDPGFDRALYQHSPDAKAAKESQEPYEALSYTWGCFRNPAVVQVLGDTDMTPTTYLEVTRNLETALRNLRQEHCPRVLWIDAICIDQSNIAERNVQVKRMKDIYRRSYRTIIWLGQAENDSSNALTMLDYLGRQCEGTVSGIIIDSPGAEHMDWYGPGTSLPWTPKTWDSVMVLLNRPWFDRVWVLQEALLSGSRAIVQCGSCTIPWSMLRKAMLALAAKVGLPADLRHFSTSYIPALKSPANNLGYLSWVTNRQCHDPRDKVYGLLGLMSHDVVSEIKLDYALPVHDVYKSAFLSLVRTSRRLELLQYCSLDHRLREGPSWIPNWNATARKFGTRPISHPYIAQYSTTAHAKPIDHAILEVVGSKCATVESVHPIMLNSDKPQEILRGMRNLESELDLAHNYVTGQHPLDALLQTLFMGRVTGRLPDQWGLGWPSLEDLRSSYLAAVSGQDQRMLAHLKNNALSDHGAFIFASDGLFGFSRGDSAIKTGKRELACQMPDYRIYAMLTSVATELGDCIYTILGCSCPVILRPTTQGQFLVVGECYLHGMMDEENILGRIPESWQVRISSQYEVVLVEFINLDTGYRTCNDPRLPPMPSDWKETEKAAYKDYGLGTKFMNTLTGETIHSDPRMTADALRERGVELEMLQLV